MELMCFLLGIATAVLFIIGTYRKHGVYTVYMVDAISGDAYLIDMHRTEKEAMETIERQIVPANHYILLEVE